MPGKKEDFEASRSWWLEHRDLLDLVGYRERVIVTVYYGLDGDEPVTLEEAGRKFGVGQERARQLRNFAKAMAKRVLEMSSTRRKIYEACQERSACQSCSRLSGWVLATMPSTSGRFSES